MRVLVACEFSGIVREAFSRRGHDAYSCDLLPSDIPGKHIQGSVLDFLYDDWDLMIAHPPCTYLSAAGLHYCRDNKDRTRKRSQAIAFVAELMAAPIGKIAIENPVGYISTALRKPDQTVRMNMFGHAEAIKPTCLWLKGLPRLIPTNEVEPRRASKRSSEWYSKTKTQKLRSKTFQGFAEAMAEQWGDL